MYWKLDKDNLLSKNSGGRFLTLRGASSTPSEPPTSQQVAEIQAKLDKNVTGSVKVLEYRENLTCLDLKEVICIERNIIHAYNREYPDIVVTLYLSYGENINVAFAEDFDHNASREIEQILIRWGLFRLGQG